MSLPTTRYLVSWNLGDVAGACAGFAGRVCYLPLPPLTHRSCTAHCRRTSATSLPTTRYLVSWNLGDVAGAGAGFAGRVRDLSLPPAHAPRTAGAYLLCHYLPHGTSSRGI
jgi:hypothetical protein